VAGAFRSPVLRQRIGWPASYAQDMDFRGPSVFLGPRDGASTGSDPSWPAWSRAVDDEGEREDSLAPVRSYAEAEGLVRTLGAERLFVPAEVLADMVRQGAGPS